MADSAITLSLLDDPYITVYIFDRIEIQQTEEFSAWLKSVRDRSARTIILGRIARLANGNPGDVDAIGRGVSEMRIHFGPGYRVYFVRRGETTAVLLVGGSKKTQVRDIKAALALAARLETSP